MKIIITLTDTDEKNIDFHAKMKGKVSQDSPSLIIARKIMAFLNGTANVNFIDDTRKENKK